MPCAPQSVAGKLTPPLRSRLISTRLYLETPPMRAWPLLLLFVTPIRAQTQPHTIAPETTGTVTGHVFCADTNQPARFAKVSLEAIRNAAATSSQLSGPSATSVETTLDGSFALTGVKPGAYYVVVEKEGYVRPRDIFTQKQMDDPSPEMRALIAAALPRVTVEGGHTEQAEVRLERGAAISGTVLYDDGSPASGLEVKILRKDVSGKWVLPAREQDIFRDGTDDRGYFRIAGLLGGEYLVETGLTLTGTKTISSGPDAAGHSVEFAMLDIVSTLPYYGSGTPRKSQATGIKLAPGQELTGQDMMIPISKLHKLTGRVAAGTDAHLVNAATVAVVTREGNEQIATAEISRADGLFHFEFVPDGDYLLRVTNARDVTWEAAAPAATGILLPFPTQDKERVLASYGGAEQPLLLSGDMLDVIVTVPPNTAPTSPTTAAKN
jgi:hypothetical protein